MNTKTKRNFSKKLTVPKPWNEKVKEGDLCRLPRPTKATIKGTDKTIVVTTGRLITKTNNHFEFAAGKRTVCIQKERLPVVQ